MWSRDALVPHQLAMAVTWVFVTFAAWLAALFAWWMLVMVEGVLAGGWLLAVWLVHWNAITVVAAVVAGAVGLVTVTGPTSEQRLRRFWLASAVAAAVAFTVVGVSGARAWIESRDFDAAAFRTAHAESAADLDDEAYKAVASGELIGMTPAELERALGPPDRVGRTHHLYVWEVGFINDFLGMGDGGRLYVQFDPAFGAVRDAKVDTSW